MAKRQTKAEQDTATQGQDQATEPVAVVESAPLEAPPQLERKVPDPLTVTSGAAIAQALHHRHVAVVNERDEPVDLEQVLVRDSPVGNTRRATSRVYEKTIVPGSDQPRKRLLFGEGAVITDPVYEALQNAVREATSDQGAAQQ